MLFLARICTKSFEMYQTPLADLVAIPDGQTHSWFSCGPWEGEGKEGRWKGEGQGMETVKRAAIRLSKDSDTSGSIKTTRCLKNTGIMSSNATF